MKGILKPFTLALIVLIAPALLAKEMARGPALSPNHSLKRKKNKQKIPQKEANKKRPQTKNLPLKKKQPSPAGGKKKPGDSPKKKLSGKSKNASPREILEKQLSSLPQKDLQGGLRFVVVVLLFTLLPALFILMTGFTRILIVLSFFKKALSAQEIPPTSVIFGLAMILTAVVMTPCAKKIYAQALLPYSQSDISAEKAGTRALKILKNFMLSQAREDELLLFIRAQKAPIPEKKESLSLQVVFPAFVVSEIRRAFEMGLLLYLPFLLIDLIVSVSLLSTGMAGVPHHAIAFPLKVGIFISVNGFNLLIWGLLQSFKG